jgi:cytidine deaminase
MQVMVEQPNDPNHAEPDLSRLAEGVLENAYAPYSRFKVGVAIRTQGGGVFPGCNVENVSFPVGICAERAAIAAAVAAEGPSMRVATLVLTARNAGEPAPCTPCGACRQALAEFGADAKVYHRGAQGWRCDGVGDLLPFSFVFKPEGG